MIISFLTLEIKFQYHYSIIANFVHVLIPWFYTRKTKKKMKEYYYYFIKCSIYYLKSFKLKKYQDIKYKIKKSLNNIIYQKWITLSSKIINPSLTDPFSSNTIIVHMDYVTHTWTRICSVARSLKRHRFPPQNKWSNQSSKLPTLIPAGT